jgi:hypothetical protein
VVTGSDQNKWDNLNNIRRETSRHFRNKRRKYLNYNIDELSMNNEMKKI